MDVLRKPKTNHNLNVIMSTVFKLRSVLPLEHFISIRFKLIYPVNLTGHLSYLRVDYEGYNLYKGDSLDKAILEGISKVSSNAEFNYRTTLITEQQLEQALKITGGGISKDFLFHFIPEINSDNYKKLARGGNFNSIPLALTRTFWSNLQNEVDMAMPSELIQTLRDKNFSLLKTIKRL